MPLPQSGKASPFFQDEFSRAAEGEIRLYAVMLAAFMVLREDGFTRYRFRNS